MDTFIETMVTKRKTMTDHLLTAGILILAIVLIMLSLSIRVLGELGIFLAAGFVYLGYRLITSRNVEYEYIVTNGDIDIDKIISRRRRKRLFSSSCKGFDIVAPVKSNSFSQTVQGLKRIDASSSIDSPGAFFATLNYKGEKTCLIFEPDERILNNFKVYIPRNIYTK